MSIWSFLGGGVVESVESVAKEWIETSQEKAEAAALFVKTLDPNGKMRRDLSRFTSQAYAFYLGSMVLLAILYFFGLGDPVKSKEAMEFMSELFLPITTAWGSIVTASFGVNGVNSFKGK